MYDHPLFGFAEILKERCDCKVLGGMVENKEVISNLVIYNGKYGVGMTSAQDNNWKIGIFDTYPLQDINNIREFILDEANDFLMMNYMINIRNIVKIKLHQLG